MCRHILKRLLLTFITLVGVSVIAFFLVRLAGGDPARQMLSETATEAEIEVQRAKMGLDKPYIVQYFTYINGILHGDLGYSYIYNMECGPLIWKRLVQTAKLTLAALIFGLLFAVPLGLLAGTHKGTIIDTIAMLFALIGQAMPQVWLCLLMILVFGVKLKWLPVQGNGGIKYIIMPAICAGVNFASSVTRMIRSGMIDVIQEDYIVATSARGVPQFTVYVKYAFRNALLPVITLIGGGVGSMLAGSMLIESIFGWPGLGQLTMSAIGMRDFQLIQSILLICATIMVFCIMIVDILYTIIDKRIEFN